MCAARASRRHCSHRSGGGRRGGAVVQQSRVSAERGSDLYPVAGRAVAQTVLRHEPRGSHIPLPLCGSPAGTPVVGPYSPTRVGGSGRIRTRRSTHHLSVVLPPKNAGRTGTLPTQAKKRFICSNDLCQRAVGGVEQRAKVRAGECQSVQVARLPRWRRRRMIGRTAHWGRGAQCRHPHRRCRQPDDRQCHCRCLHRRRGRGVPPRGCRRPLATAGALPSPPAASAGSTPNRGPHLATRARDGAHYPQSP